MHPIIDKNPTDPSCIYLTLHYVSKQCEICEILRIATTCITFDHLLWLKAVDIIESQKLRIVCRLGLFHMIMIFLGSVGYVINSSGLTEALQHCYGFNTINHMMTGKAVKRIKRAIRVHLLVEKALNIMLLRKFLKISANEVPDMCQSGPALNADDVNSLKIFYDDVVRLQCSIDRSSASEVLTKLQRFLEDPKIILAERSQTAKLWLQYCRYVDVLKSLLQQNKCPIGICISLVLHRC